MRLATESAPSFSHRDVADALRIRQWHKNLLVFVPLVFAFKIRDLESISRTVILFVSFCMASSAVYLFNDVIDRKADASHPLKKNRAVASGRFSSRAAVGTAGVLLVASLLIAFEFLTIGASIVLLSYLALQFFYNAGLRRMPPADVISIALGFILRAVAGAVAIDVPFSEWLLICTFFGAVRLAMGKRQAELIAGRTGLRRGWDEIPDAVIAGLGAITSSALLISYTLYCFVSSTAKLLGAAESGGALSGFPPLLVSLPIVFFGIVRYEMLASKGGAADPEMLPMRDAQLAAAIAAWFVVSFAALYLWRTA